MTEPAASKRPRRHGFGLATIRHAFANPLAAQRGNGHFSVGCLTANYFQDVFRDGYRNLPVPHLAQRRKLALSSSKNTVTPEFAITKFPSDLGNAAHRPAA
jgi:hypothetical protein